LRHLRAGHRDAPVEDEERHAGDAQLASAVFHCGDGAGVCFRFQHRTRRAGITTVTIGGDNFGATADSLL
jgi:hypothetical protein